MASSCASILWDEGTLNYGVQAVCGGSGVLLDVGSTELLLSSHIESDSNQVFCWLVQLCNKRLTRNRLRSKPLHIYMRVSGRKTTLVTNPRSVLCG